MNTTHKYEVFPEEQKLIQRSECSIKGAEGLGMGGGCLLWGVIYVVVAWSLVFVAEYGYGIEWHQAERIGYPTGLIFATVATVALHYYFKWVFAYESAKRYEAERVVTEAANVTANLRCIYESSINLAAECTEHFKQGSRWLRQAEAEYEDNAPYYYWDAVENTNQHLLCYKEKLCQLSQNAEVYYRELINRKHSFPVFPVTSEIIPDASPLLPEIRRVVRLGHKDSHFTNILGHRRTREALIYGFNETVRNISWSINNSISVLNESVSSSIRMLADKEIKGKEVLADALEKQDKRLVELNRMVDNIQHNRKPR